MTRLISQSDFVDDEQYRARITRRLGCPVFRRNTVWCLDFKLPFSISTANHLYDVIHHGKHHSFALYAIVSWTPALHWCPQCLLFPFASTLSYFRSILPFISFDCYCRTMMFINVRCSSIVFSAVADVFLNELAALRSYCFASPPLPPLVPMLLHLFRPLLLFAVCFLCCTFSSCAHHIVRLDALIRLLRFICFLLWLARSPFASHVSRSSLRQLPRV